MASVALLSLFGTACYNPTPTGSGDDGSSGSGDVGTTADETSNTNASSSTATTASTTTESTNPTSTASSDPTTTSADTTTVDDTASDACANMVVDGSETCDDGNMVDGDGCSATCEAEPGWMCDDEPSVCTAADLRVYILSAMPVADVLAVSYVVENSGGLASGNYDVDLWSTTIMGLATPPGPGRGGVITLADRPSLAPGELVMFSDNIANAPMGANVAFAAVDVGQELVEIDENDDIALGFGWTSAGLEVHRSFPSTDGPLPIPDDGTEAAASVVVMVNNFSPSIWISLNITHPAVEELDVWAEAPNGATVTLVSGEASGANFGGTSFQVGAPAISGAAAPFLGVFSPTGMWDSPAVLNGVWVLHVSDLAPGNTGRINYFQITSFEIDP